MFHLKCNTSHSTFKNIVLHSTRNQLFKGIYLSSGTESRTWCPRPEYLRCTIVCGKGCGVQRDVENNGKAKRLDAYHGQNHNSEFNCVLSKQETKSFFSARRRLNTFYRTFCVGHGYKRSQKQQVLFICFKEKGSGPRFLGCGVYVCIVVLLFCSTDHR